MAEERLMGLAGQLGKAVLKRIESSPGVQAQIARSERTTPVLRVARKAAYSSLDDEAAKAMIRERLDVEAPVVEEALTHFRRRDDYIDDRTYRLLAAAAADTRVAPIPADRTELFRQEESIGKMPMEQAFQRLAEIEPGLLDLKSQVEAVEKNCDPGSCGLPKHIKEPLHRLVGGGASSDHELLHTSLATSIVHQYLEILTGNTRFGTPDISYFESPIKHFVATGVLFDFRRSKHRRQ
jgi:hypothetical protein